MSRNTDTEAVEGTDTEELWNAVAADVSGEYRVTVEYDSLNRRSTGTLEVSGVFNRVIGNPFTGGTVSVREDDGGVITVSATGFVKRSSTGADLGDMVSFTVERLNTEDSEDDSEDDEDAELETDGGEDVDMDALAALEPGEELTITLTHDTTGKAKEYTGTVADHPYMDAHDDWTLVLTDVTDGQVRIAGGSPGSDSGHVIIYADGTLEGRPSASRQYDIGTLTGVAGDLPDTEDDDSEPEVRADGGEDEDASEPLPEPEGASDGAVRAAVERVDADPRTDGGEDTEPEPFASEDDAVAYQSEGGQAWLDMGILTAAIGSRWNRREDVDLHSVPREGVTAYHVPISGKYVHQPVYDTLRDLGFRVIGHTTELDHEDINPDADPAWSATTVLKVQRTRPATEREVQMVDPEYLHVRDKPELQRRIRGEDVEGEDDEDSELETDGGEREDSEDAPEVMTDGGRDVTPRPVDPADVSEGDTVTVEVNPLPIRGVEQYPTEVTGEVIRVDRVDTREYHETGHIIIQSDGDRYTLTYEPRTVAFSTGDRDGVVYGDPVRLEREHDPEDREADGGWTPEPADLRDGEVREDSHAARNAAAVRRARAELKRMEAADEDANPGSDARESLPAGGVGGGDGDE